MTVITGTRNHLYITLTLPMYILMAHVIKRRAFKMGSGNGVAGAMTMAESNSYPDPSSKLYHMNLGSRWEMMQDTVGALGNSPITKARAQSMVPKPPVIVRKVRFCLL